MNAREPAGFFWNWYKPAPSLLPNSFTEVSKHLLQTFNEFQKIYRILRNTLF